jgi:hypothetical protein
MPQSDLSPGRALFKTPDSFNPERALTSNPALEEAASRHGFIPSLYPDLADGDSLTQDPVVVADKKRKKRKEESQSSHLGEVSTQPTRPARLIKPNSKFH